MLSRGQWPSSVRPRALLLESHIYHLVLLVDVASRGQLCAGWALVNCVKGLFGLDLVVGQLGQMVTESLPAAVPLTAPLFHESLEVWGTG